MHSQFATFPVEIINHIASLAGDNAAFLLFLTGSKRLSSKLFRTRDLCLKWTHYAYFSWYDCASFLSCFSQLKALHLTTWSPELSSRERLEPDLLPATLTDLTLDFYDALSILSSSSALVAPLFSKLVSLAHLSISQKCASAAYELDFSHFPSSLRSLHLSSIPSLNAAPWINASTLSSLPLNLESLSLIDISITSDSHLIPVAISCVSPTHGGRCQTSLKHLSLSFLDHLGYPIEIMFVGPQLRTLDTKNVDDILYGSFSILNPNPKSPPYHLPAIAYRTGRAVHPPPTDVSFARPISTLPSVLFPSLTTLGYNAVHYSFSWHHLERFPPTLTCLKAPFHLELDPSETLATVKELNNKFTEDQMPEHALPKLIERLHNSAIEMNSSVLSQFPKLRVCSDLQPLSRIDCNLPPGLLYLSLEKLQPAQVGLLPPGLTSLTVDHFLPDGADDWDTIGPTLNLYVQQLPAGLKHFDLRLSPLVPPMIGYLPYHLEELSAIASCRTMRALKSAIDGQRTVFSFNSNQGPPSDPQSAPVASISAQGRLKSLRKLKIGHRFTTAEPESLEVSLDTIPQNVTHLTLTSPPFVAVAESASIRHHTSLQTLVIVERAAMDPMELLPEIPPQLQVLSCTFSSSLDFNDYRCGLVWYNFGQRLTGLRELHIESYPVSHWMIALNTTDKYKRPSLPSFSIWTRLPTSLRHLLVLKYLRMPPRTLETASLRFAYHCLPRGLAILKTHENQNNHFSRDLLHRLNVDILVAGSNIWYRVLIPMIKLQFPLLLGGLALTASHCWTSTFLTPSFATWLAKFHWLPPNLSVSPLAQDGIYELSTGNPPERTSQIPSKLPKHRRGFVSPSGHLLHLSNVLVGLLFAYMFRISKVQHPWLWYYQWLSIAGSAISFPFCLYQYLRSKGRPHARDLLSHSSYSSQFVVTFGGSTIANMVMSGLLILPIATNCSTPVIASTTLLSFSLGAIRNSLFRMS